MNNNNDGFFLAEILLSLTVFLIISLFLLPLFIVFIEHRHELDRRMEANRLLYDELITAQVEQTPVEEKTMIKNGQSYTLFHRSGNSARLEVCVHYEIQTKTIEMCEYTN